MLLSCNRCSVIPKCNNNKNTSTRFANSKWRALDPIYDTSDDQQDIRRGKGMVPSLFQGQNGVATHEVMMSSNDYITHHKTLSDVDENFYIAPRYFDKVALHVAKNMIECKQRNPLILGIWGEKGQGKTFQLELIHKALDICPVIISAGELESENAGEPAKLIRQRYHESADLIKKGKLSTLIVNDIDAGIGRMGQSTQYTVNNQTVSATLMNIADNPTNVQLPGVYNMEETNKVPIIVTGNDFSTLYEPLTRDGRMEKFFWKPNFDEKLRICENIFTDLDLFSLKEFVEKYKDNSIDFFGAVKSKMFENELKTVMQNVGIQKFLKECLHNTDIKLPKSSFEILDNIAKNIENENDTMENSKLSDMYLY